MIKLCCIKTFERSGTGTEYYTKGKIYEVLYSESRTSFYVDANENHPPCVFTIKPDLEPFLSVYDYFLPLTEMRENKLKDLLCQ